MYNHVKNTENSFVLEAVQIYKIKNSEPLQTFA